MILINSSCHQIRRHLHVVSFARETQLLPNRLLLLVWWLLYAISGPIAQIITCTHGLNSHRVGCVDPTNITGTLSPKHSINGLWVELLAAVIILLRGWVQVHGGQVGGLTMLSSWACALRLLRSSHVCCFLHELGDALVTSLLLAHWRNEVASTITLILHLVVERACIGLLWVSILWHHFFTLRIQGI